MSPIRIPTDLQKIYFCTVPFGSFNSKNRQALNVHGATFAKTVGEYIAEQIGKSETVEIFVMEETFMVAYAHIIGINFSKQISPLLSVTGTDMCNPFPVQVTDGILEYSQEGLSKLDSVLRRMIERDVIFSDQLGYHPQNIVFVGGGAYCRVLAKRLADLMDSPYKDSQEFGREPDDLAVIEYTTRNGTSLFTAFSGGFSEG
jgi:hypothetical protein